MIFPLYSNNIVSLSFSTYARFNVQNSNVIMARMKIDINNHIFLKEELNAGRKNKKGQVNSLPFKKLFNIIS
jgi:hypothetical protein